MASETMNAIARNDAQTENELARLDRTAMHAAGAHYAEIQVSRHAIVTSTEGDAENVRDYVTENTDLRFTGCHPNGKGYTVTFRYDE